MKLTLGAIGLAVATGLTSSLASTLPSVQIALEDTNLVLTFRGQLQYCAQVQGPYTNFVGARSPLRVPWPSVSAVFWRARQDADTMFDQYLSAGELHTVALRTNGSLWSWGLNNRGALGDGTFTTTNAPQPIATSATWSTVAAGFDYTLALQSNQTLWAWGNNGSGRLGNGASNSTNSPQPVTTNITWRAVSAGAAHTVAVRIDGTLWAWGLNQWGQLGDGTFSTASTPQPISTNAMWQSVSTAWDYTVALRADGTLWTWGNNNTGQLGNGTFANTNTPQPIATNAQWRAVAAGGTGPASHSLALRADGTLWAWGDNSEGQLGVSTYTVHPHELAAASRH
jgi:alpha-tubulin suppressor-like RCC1 family protein